MFCARFPPWPQSAPRTMRQSHSSVAVYLLYDPFQGWVVGCIRQPDFLLSCSYMLVLVFRALQAIRTKYSRPKIEKLISETVCLFDIHTEHVESGTTRSALTMLVSLSFSFPFFSFCAERFNFCCCCVNKTKTLLFNSMALTPPPAARSHRARKES